MARLTRRQVLQAACGGYALLASALLAACGNGELQPTKGAGRPVGAAPLAASPTVPVSPTIPSTPIIAIYPPLPTSGNTIHLPTVVLPPNRETVTLKPTVANVVPWTPAPAPNPTDPFCFTYRPTRAAQPVVYTQMSTLVVVASISTIHAPRWSTPDGQRPANPHDPQSTARIFTLVEAQVEQTLKGVAPSSVVIDTPVGTIGEDCARVADGIKDFTILGERVVLFLVSPSPVEPTQIDGTPLWWLYERYTITPEGNATNPYQTIPLAELVTIVTTAGGTPGSPLPAPLGTPHPTSTP